MPYPYVMRYYHPFPEAIPRLKAGCSRVTHPSATKLNKQACLTPFDLHVLGVPPAFVLSQDQTLYKFVSSQRFFRLSVTISSLRITRNYCSHSVIVFLLTLLLLFFSSALFQALRKGILGFQFIFVSIVQFSRCKRFFSFHSLLKFSSCFLYRCNSFIIPHFLKFVKRFFKTFFKVFSFASSH